MPFSDIHPQTCVTYWPFFLWEANWQRIRRAHGLVCLKVSSLGFKAGQQEESFEHGGFICSGGEAQTNTSKSPRL